jgi:hypothetical protein
MGAIGIVAKLTIKELGEQVGEGALRCGVEKEFAENLKSGIEVTFGMPVNAIDVQYHEENPNLTKTEKFAAVLYRLPKNAFGSKTTS